MPTVPIRGLAEKGILRDPSPYQLDLNAWSGGSNMRFHANKAERAPIWRTIYSILPEEPVFTVGLEATSGYDSVVVAGADGRSWMWNSGTLNEVTPTSGFSAGSDPRSFTSTLLGDVIYLNRPSAVPQYYGPGSSHFANIPNQECGWTCRSLRVFGNYLIALNVTKPTYTDPFTTSVVPGGTFTNLFKWSDLTLEGQPPGGWDPFNPASSAGENPLEELNTPIVDGLPMRSFFVIYSENQIWAAQQVASQAVFQFTKLFNEGGMLAPNCGVEVDGIHYVFGINDIYKHDGIQKVSIIDKRNRDFVFRNLNKQKSEVCFAAYMPNYNSIVFGYNTGDNSAFFNGCDRCNQGAVYDLTADTWSFIDLPNVSAITQANIDTVATYISSPSTLTYANIAGSYYDQDNTFVKNVVACSGVVGGSINYNRLLAYDFMNKGGLTIPYEPECNAPAVLERTGVALDQMGSDLATYKKVRRVFPLVTTFEGVDVQIEIGGAETPGGTITWNPPVTFNPTTQYKIDGIKGGRYLAIRFTVPSPADFEVAGFDLDLTDGGRR